MKLFGTVIRQLIDGKVRKLIQRKFSCFLNKDCLTNHQYERAIAFEAFGFV
jgi:hypothetical protein